MNKKDILDEIITVSINKEIDNIDLPPMDDIWQNIETHIKSEKRNNSFKINNKIASILVVLTVCSYLALGLNNSGEANFKRVLNFITKKSGKEVNIDLNYKKNDPIKESNNSLIEHSLSLEEAKERADFIVKYPTYIPKEYSFEKATLSEYDGKGLYLKVIYSSNDNRKIIIEEEGIPKEYAQGINLNEENSQIKQINKNGFIYNIIEKNNNRVTVIWDMFEVKYTIRGENKDELIKLALSIK
jgi:hypothetical protein